MDLAKWSRQAAGGGTANAVADGFSKAVEFVATPMLCGAGGYFLDRWVGTSPIFTIVLFLWALSVTVGMTVRDYNAKMKAEDDRLMGRAK
ncbi:MAG: AtpZ/AtpI family protein [Acidimicrobiia bacterium]|nr:AtpZ/AtpI family protein [Acidimicrobiia bacterium]MBV8986052.1 AtpZ/AtpI family protein [Acidimicrobiia bacterium]MBV9040559.1 AtpZ/AtpI family protein [Acidimicrobiia bacterium]MBV9284841.1 AtpZ/AtpI family protein [Acidimicrobiia bacterium]